MLKQILALGTLYTLFHGGVCTRQPHDGIDTEKHVLRDLKEHWELVFGQKADSCASAMTLDLAIHDVTAGADRLAKSLSLSHKEAARKLGRSLGDDEHTSYANQLGCLSYSTGLELLRHQMEKAVTPALRAIPFVVNKARNAICVHFKKVPANFEKNFIFHYEIPVALVIDKQLYKVVDEMYSQNATLHQALGASPESRSVFLVVYPYR